MHGALDLLHLDLCICDFEGQKWNEMILGNFDSVMRFLYSYDASPSDLEVVASLDQNFGYNMHIRQAMNAQMNASANVPHLWMTAIISIKLKLPNLKFR